MKKYLIVVFLFVSAPSAHGAITFTNGFWSTTFDSTSDLTFDTSECRVGSYHSQFSCPDMGGSDFISMSYCHNQKCSEDSVITTSGNYPGGGGGRGLRIIVEENDTYGSGNYGSDGYLQIAFPSPQTEFWVRWYIKWESGTDINHDKDVYVYPGANVYFDCTWWGTDRMVIAGATYNSRGCGNAQQFDDQWHCNEFHWKENGDGTGVARYWWDGRLSGTWTITSGGPANGTTFFQIHQSMGMADTGVGCRYYWIDDLAIATPSYTGFVKDSSGNDMIGPVVNGGGAGSGPSVPSAPSGLTVK